MGNYDAECFMDDHAFTPDQSARLGDETVVRPWIFDAHHHVPPLEHTLGLIDADGRLTPAGAAFRDAFAAAREASAPQPRGRVIDLHVGQDPLLHRSAAAPGGSVLEHWMEAPRAGGRPMIRVARDHTRAVSGGIRTGGASATRLAF